MFDKVTTFGIIFIYTQHFVIDTLRYSQKQTSTMQDEPGIVVDSNRFFLDGWLGFNVLKLVRMDFEQTSVS